MLDDHACLKESLFNIKLELVVTNLCNLRYFLIKLQTHRYGHLKSNYIHISDLRLEINVILN